MTDLKKRILERVEPDLFQINKALAENLDPKTSLVEKEISNQQTTGINLYFSHSWGDNHSKPFQFRIAVGIFLVVLFKRYILKKPVGPAA